MAAILWRRRSRPWLVALAIAACVLAPLPVAAQAAAPVRPVRILLLYGVSPELPDIASFTKQLRFLMTQFTRWTTERCPAGPLRKCARDSTDDCAPGATLAALPPSPRL